MEFKNKGFGDEFIDNQRRSELLLQGILERYPDCDKIPDVAYHLGDIYETYKPKPQFLRAATYYERSFQWSKSSSTDARLRAAKIYDRQLRMYDKAKELYKAVMNNDSSPERVAEAERRMRELTAGR
jgi:tetratricopeptide (TPR) repeat protein